ncbi:MAG TPA: DUF692 domain-containing protein [Propionicimonas sp.]|jgi:hypothetical protein
MSANSSHRWGIGLRRTHFEEIDSIGEGVDFLEIVSENFMRFGGKPRRVLETLKQRFPIIPHGVALSIGGPNPLDERYLQSLGELLDWLDPPWFSDHLCYSSAFGVEYHELVPLPFTEEAIDHVAGRAREVQRRLGRPLLLENPTYYLKMPGAQMTEAEFVREVVERADCGLLLDVNNVYVNAKNHGYDPYAFIDAMPRERVRQLHIAGHDASGEFLIDTHGAQVDPAVLDLYAYTLRRLGPVWTLLEWDHNLPPLSGLLEENARVRAAGARALARQEAA